MEFERGSTRSQSVEKWLGRSMELSEDRLENEGMVNEECKIL
jgi:hypothetical protein